MDIRRTINEQPIVAPLVALVMIVGASVAITLHFKRLTNSSVGKAFYSDDDGKTWFIDSNQRIPPFDHFGKEAVAARVYRCGKSKPFVAYLEKYSDEQRAAAEQFQRSQLDRDARDRSPTAPELGRYAKKPGDPKWVSGVSPADQAAYLKATTVACPDGSAIPTIVRPSDTDAR